MPCSRRKCTTHSPMSGTCCTWAALRARLATLSLQGLYINLKRSVLLNWHLLAPPRKLHHATHLWHNPDSQAQTAQFSFFLRSLLAQLLWLCLLILVAVVVDDLSDLSAH